MTAIYIVDGGRMLMLYRVGSRVVEPSWCGIGGHFERMELDDPRRCALRELREETGFGPEDIGPLGLRYVTLRLKNDEIRQNYYFFADWKRGDATLPSCPEGKLEWVALDAVMARVMPVTAGHMLRHYLEVGRHTDALYAGATTPDGMNFTELHEF